jgi:hypothetical protein
MASDPLQREVLREHLWRHDEHVPPIEISVRH